ncbi:MAG: YhbY family RNA-binding protein [Erysipelotrichaceae bacterium]|jgi:RNA-binding protein
MLKKHQKQYLKSMANELKPTIIVGKNGLTDNVIASVMESLNAHELVKISVLNNSQMKPEQLSIEIASETNSEIICQIGRKIVLYKKNVKEPKIILPR